MKIESLMYRLLMDGTVSPMELLLYIIGIYIVLRFIFVMIARVYLNRQLPIKKGNKEESKILIFYVRLLDLPLLIYTAFIVYSFFNATFEIFYLRWYLILFIIIIGIEAVTGIVRKSYVNRLTGEREYILEVEKAEAEREQQGN